MQTYASGHFFILLRERAYYKEDKMAYGDLSYFLPQDARYYGGADRMQMAQRNAALQKASYLADVERELRQIRESGRQFDDRLAYDYAALQASERQAEDAADIERRRNQISMFGTAGNIGVGLGQIGAGLYQQSRSIDWDREQLDWAERMFRTYGRQPNLGLELDIPFEATTPFELDLGGVLEQDFELPELDFGSPTDDFIDFSDTYDFDFLEDDLDFDFF